jgi:hypothetical protein
MSGEFFLAPPPLATHTPLVKIRSSAPPSPYDVCVCVHVPPVVPYGLHREGQDEK